MSSTHIPNEIFLHIFDCLRAAASSETYHNTLTSFAVTCQAWHPVAVDLLYGRIHIKSVQQLRLLVQTLSQSPDVAGRVSDITLTCTPRAAQGLQSKFIQWDDLTLPLPQEALANLTALRSATFMNVISEPYKYIYPQPGGYNAQPNIFSRPSHWRFIRSLTGCRSLRALTLRGFGFAHQDSHYIGLTRTVWSIPQLSHLYIHGSSVKVERERVHPDPSDFPERCGELVHVHVCTQRIDTAVINANTAHR